MVGERPLITPLRPGLASAESAQKADRVFGSSALYLKVGILAQSLRKFPSRLEKFTLPNVSNLHLEPSKPLAGLRFSLVGPGRVGTSLASWLVAGGGQAVEIAGRRAGKELARSLGARFCTPADLESKGLDLLLITAADHVLADLAVKLARRPQARVALHTAGSLDGDVLAPLRSPVTAIGSLHPLKAFSGPLPDPQEARGTFFAWDGDPEAQDLARRVVTAWGGEGRSLSGPDRVLYHLAASLAAGGVTTLLALAADLAERLDLPPEVLRGYFTLAHTALDQAARAEHPAAAITGPAARGDQATLDRHRAALTARYPEALELFDALTSMTTCSIDQLRSSAINPSISSAGMGSEK